MPIPLIATMQMAKYTLNSDTENFVLGWVMARHDKITGHILTERELESDAERGPAFLDGYMAYLNEYGTL